MMYCKYLCSLLFSFFFLLGWTQEVEFTCSFGEPNQNVGGKDGMERLIRNEFVYPATLYEKGEEGLVKIQYRLTQSGQPIEVTTISSTHPDCKAMAEWIFSKIEFYKDDKRGVNPVYEFRLSFIPKKYKKLLKKRPFTTPPTPYTPIDSSGKVYVYNTI